MVAAALGLVAKYPQDVANVGLDEVGVAIRVDIGESQSTAGLSPGGKGSCPFFFQDVFSVALVQIELVRLGVAQVAQPSRPSTEQF